MLGETGSGGQIQQVSPETVQRERQCRHGEGQDLKTWRQAESANREGERDTQTMDTEEETGGTDE